jgi:hypothetical protein
VGSGGGTRGRRWFRRAALTVVAVGLVAVAGVLAFAALRHGRPYEPPALAYEGDSTGLKQTVIVPTLDTPMPAGRNVVWCSSFQVAWNHLRDDVVKGPIQLANAQPIADRLNQAPESEAGLPEGSYYATAGRVDEGIVGTIQRDLAAEFPSAPLPVFDNVAQDALVAYAYLTVRVKFTIPFFDSDEPLRFRASSGEEAEVTAFGIRPKDVFAYSKLRSQVEVVYAGYLAEEERFRAAAERARGEAEVLRHFHVPPEFAVDLCRDSSPVRIVLAVIPLGGSLREMLRDLSTKIDAWSPPPEANLRSFGPDEELLVPDVFYRVRHRFTDLEGPDRRLLSPGCEGYWVQEACQSMEFRLDRSGTELASEAKVPVPLEPRYFLFDRPFLIVMTTRGAKHPFFVMWVDNAELLCKWQEPAPDSPSSPQ